jgi:hypothetical protein
VNVRLLDLPEPLAAKLRIDLFREQTLSFARPRFTDVSFDVFIDERRGDGLDAIGGRTRSFLRLAGRLLLRCGVLTAGDVAEGFLRPPAGVGEVEGRVG